MTSGHLQIGEIAERTGLSIRTIRYYGEVGLAEPSARSQGRFRRYTEPDVQRLLLIREMKPLDYGGDRRHWVSRGGRWVDELVTAPDRSPCPSRSALRDLVLCGLCLR